MNAYDVMEALGDVNDCYLAEATPSVPRPRRAWKKPAVIAACLCLLLVGTAFAAGYIAGNFAKIEFFGQEKWKDGYFYSGYTLSGGTIAYIPVNTLSEESRNVALESGASTNYRTFESLEAAEEYYQISLPDNSLLEECDAGCTTAMFSNGSGPTRIEFEQHYFRVKGTGNIHLDVYATVYTELSGESIEVWSRFYYPIAYLVTTEEYQSENATAIIAHIQCKQEGTPLNFYGRDYYSAHMIVNGVIYQLQLFYRSDQEQALELLKNILDGFY